MTSKRFKIFAITIVSSTLLLAGCTSSRFSNSNSNLSTPAQLSPITNSSIQSAALPPLDGQNGSTVNDVFDPNANNNIDPNNGDPALVNGQLANANNSFINIDEVNSSNLTPNGRDISGSLSVAKLLGTWRVSAEQKTCNLNLTQTTKSGTNRYRASTPGCDILVLSLTSSWQLAGTQVQLFDNSGAIIGAFQRSGNRFVGTLSGGIAASMDG